MPSHLGPELRRLADLLWLKAAAVHGRTVKGAGQGDDLAGLCRRDGVAHAAAGLSSADYEAIVKISAGVMIVPQNTDVG